ncbi:MAG: tripartite tricarboxylate transporter permease [Candidatus Aenigmarchaeota archaeon]|nr:tripartite tricarboxylate transporter permease [Candidatus Aenigmarchaeota archaeon]
MLELLLFALAGILAGVVFGLVPGLHPNTMVAFTPLLAPLEPAGAAVFLISMGASNIMADFIPSVMLSAPDAGNELSVLPAQRLMSQGHGYSAIRFMVIGFVSSFLLFISFAPLLHFIVPAAFEMSRHFIFAVLIFISCLMVLSERRIAPALVVFSVAGAIGLVSGGMPVNPAFVLFPVLAGFFGVSSMILQIRSRSSVVLQSGGHLGMDRKSYAKSSFAGCLGGIFSGFLPGVGSSEIAAIFSMKKDEKSFLVTIGAIGASNFVMSLFAVWLIGKTRSGIAVAVDNVYRLSSGDVLMVVFASMLSLGVSALFVLKASKSFATRMQKMNYSRISCAVIALIASMTFVFSGLYGLVVLVSCAALGIYAILSGVKRGLMMAALIVPTVVFFAGF